MSKSLRIMVLAYIVFGFVLPASVTAYLLYNPRINKMDRLYKFDSSRF